MKTTNSSIFFRSPSKDILRKDVSTSLKEKTDYIGTFIIDSKYEGGSKTTERWRHPQEVELTYRNSSFDMLYQVNILPFHEELTIYKCTSL